MAIENLPSPLTGDALKQSVLSPTNSRHYLAEGLLYEKSNIMFSADPGTGKSMIALQAACQLASGLPLFGALHVPKPIKVYYIQKERPYLEVQERISVFLQSIEINFDNLIVDSAIQFVNLSDVKLATAIVNRIEKYKPVIIFIDPIGAGLGGLTQDQTANNFCSVLNFIQSRLGNTFWLNHHTTKQQYNKDGEMIEKEKPFYGSQWLDAMVTGHYHLTKTERGTGWRKTKDTLGVLFQRFQLEYDPETMLSYLSTGSLLAKDKVINFINSIKSHKKSFKFSELSVATGVSDSILRDTLRAPSISGLFKKVISSGEATLYELV